MECGVKIPSSICFFSFSIFLFLRAFLMSLKISFYTFTALFPFVSHTFHLFLAHFSPLFCILSPLFGILFAIVWHTFTSFWYTFRHCLAHFHLFLVYFHLIHALYLDTASYTYLLYTTFYTIVCRYHTSTYMPHMRHVASIISHPFVAGTSLLF